MTRRVVEIVEKNEYKIAAIVIIRGKRGFHTRNSYPAPAYSLR